MSEMSSLLLAASTVQSVGTVIALVLVVGFLVYAAFNIKAGREEVGAELELAANLKPYLDDDELETTKLDRTLTFGLATLAIVGIGLPAYWLAEPGRIDGAFEEGRGGAAHGRFANGFERKSERASSYRAAGARADARYGADAAASGRGYSLPAGEVGPGPPAAPPTPRAPTDV